MRQIDIALPSIAQESFKLNLLFGGPRGRVIKDAIFSALNRSSSHRCGLEPSLGHI